MKKMMFIAAVCLAFFTQVVFALDLVTYTTSHGSVLELGVNEDHSITGFFTLNLVNTYCPQAVGVRKPIVGTSVDNTVTFTVSYPECHSNLILGGNLLLNEHIFKVTSAKIQKTSFAPDASEDSLFNV